MNEGNNNTNGRVKSKFFNQDLFNDANVNDVGSSTGGQVISWGVGGNRNNTPDINNVSLLDSTQMFNFVNTEVTDVEQLDPVVESPAPMQNNPMQNPNNGLFDSSQFANSMEGQQVITESVPMQNQEYDTNVTDVINDIKFDGNASGGGVSNDFAAANPTFFGYNANPQIMQSNVNNDMADSNVMMQQPMQQDAMQVMDPNTNQMNMMNSMEQVPAFNNEMVQPTFNGMEANQSNTVAVPTFDPFNSMAEPVTQVQPVAEVQPLHVNDPDLQMQQNSPLFSMAMESQEVAVPSGERDLNPLNIDSSVGEIDDNMRSNQPLSLMALSGEIADEAQKPKDVFENSKYFQSTPLEDNRLKVEEVAAPVAIPVVDVLAAPTRGLNMRELVISYVGEKYQKISMSAFSFCGGFFTSLYFFFRKMYVQGLILVVINLIINIVIRKSYVIGLGLSLGEFIIVGLLTNSIYLAHAGRETNKIANQNPTMNQYELQRLCASKGGTSLGLALLIVIGLSLVTTPIINKIAPMEPLFETPGPTTIDVDKKATLDEVITYQLPSEFERVDSGELPYIIEEEKWIRGRKVTVTSCGFNIFLVSGADTSKEFLTNMAEKENRYNNVMQRQISENNIWDSYEYDADAYYYTYLAKKINGHIVLVSYRRDARATENMCETHLSSIMNSIKEK